MAAAIILFLVGAVAYAQTSFSVSLKLIDEQSGEPVGFATVSLSVKGESKASKYVLSDSEGKAELTKVKKNTMPCSFQFRRPSTTDLRESFTPYRKNSSTIAAFVSQSNTTASCP